MDTSAFDSGIGRRKLYLAFFQVGLLFKNIGRVPEPERESGRLPGWTVHVTDPWQVRGGVEIVSGETEVRNSHEQDGTHCFR